MAATVLFRGTITRRDGTRCRSFIRAVGMPRGAKDGLDGADDGGSWLDNPWGSSPPSPGQKSVESVV